MTEAEWPGCEDPNRMLEHLRAGSNERKLRLFACATLRRVFSLLTEKPISEATLEFAERFADGLASRNELHGQAWGRTSDAFPVVLWNAWEAAQTSAEFAVGKIALAAVFGSKEVVTISQSTVMFLHGIMSAAERDRASSSRREEELGQARLVRDIFGNPFRTVAFDPRWRTSDVVGLARAVYDDSVFERLPVLADALMDAGCEDEQVISHCRGDGPHVRGCWVVDLILGKE